MGTTCGYEFDLQHSDAEHDHPDLDGGWSCSRESHATADYCLFHLSSEERDAFGVDDEDIAEALQDVASDRGERAKQLIGANIEDLVLEHEILKAADKHPLDLRFATVTGTLGLQQSEIEQQVDLREAEIETIDWREAKFSEAVDLTGVVVHNSLMLTSTVFEGDVDFIAGTFEGAVDFREARFHGDTCLRQTRFEEQATFDGVEFQGDANLLDDDVCFEDAEFDASVSFVKGSFRYADFVGCRFGEAATFDEAVFTRDAEFSDVTFESDVSFRGAEFVGGANVMMDDADFKRTQFQGEADFEKAEFSYVTFAAATFTEGAEFMGASFDEEAIFTDAEFEDRLDFTEARFYDDADFSTIRIHGEGCFRGAEFHGGDNVDDDDLSFTDSVFEGPANFLRTRFRFGNFAGATFNDRLLFEEAYFDGDAVFTRCHFQGWTSFEESVFDDDALFDETVFADESSFRGAEFNGGENIKTDDLTFERARFEEETDFRKVAFQLAIFRYVEFSSGARFDETRFRGELTFSNAVFDGEVVFDEARFADDASFQNAEFATTARFQGVEFQGGDNIRDDDVTFEEATFGGHIDFERAMFEYANYTAVTFEAQVDFEASEFNREAHFNDSSFEGEASFTEARFTDDADFQECTFHDDVTFLGVEFEGGYHEDDDAAFSGSVFKGNADFSEIEFRQAGFNDTHFQGDVSFHQSEFGTTSFEQAKCDGQFTVSFTTFEEPATFEDITFGSEVDAEEIRFESDVCFARAHFKTKVSFRGTEFMGGAHTVDDADFEAATFEATADFRMTEFRYANFMGVHFGGNALFKKSLFEDMGTFQNASFDESAVFSRARFTNEANFSSCRFEDEAHFDELRFEKDTTFADSKFKQDATFRSAEFEGSSNMHNDDASFEGAEFHAAADFDKASFLYANFINTIFSQSGIFTGAEFAHSVVFRPKPKESETLVNLKKSVIQGGILGQPEEGDVFYDCTDGEIHEVTLDDSHCRHGLFNHFLFCNTDFHDFDFTAHKKYLAQNNWQIHTFAAADHIRDEQAFREFTPATLENTYLKAKNCASDFGDRKAAAEFFIKEMLYRRKKNWDAAFTREDAVSASNRLKALGKWFGNSVLHQTCGYGERLWRVVYVSFVAVFLWGLAYTTASKGTTASSGLGAQKYDSFLDLLSPQGLIILGENMYFSMVTFTTLGYGDIQPVGPTARSLAGLEAFFGALLVALVVFVLGRRVAW